MKAVVGMNEYPRRRLTGEVARSADEKRLTDNQLLQMLGLESIQSLRESCNGWLIVQGGGYKELTWKKMV